MTEPADIPDEEQKRRNEKLREARIIERTAPVAGILFLALASQMLSRYLADPGVEMLLRLGGSVAGLFACIALWQQARRTVRAGGKDSFSAALLMGFVLSISLPNLADMYHNRHMSWFYTMGWATAALGVWCALLMIMEVVVDRSRAAKC